ncbi:jg8311 [Pararge aegeria aegeria]|uniref:Jg8311 protein n=1 Tax=Pararge aegeria aegeria TaxID=348720 RepID=A0A8S4SRS5_9NEOP|nr:jg8311 [Pararge aegeria aegeria]
MICCEVTPTIRLLSWDSNEHQVDLEKELATLSAQAPEGEEARYGERLIQYASENLVTEILIHPQMNTLMQCMRNLLSSFTRHRHLVHAGYTFAGNGSWIMQDGTFSLSDFTDAYQENEVQRVVRAYENSISIDIHCSTGGGEWHKLPEMPFAKHCKIRVNPTDILDSGSQAIKDFISYLNPYVVPANLEQLLVSSDVVGNIRFSHPTLYVFPGGQGDAALFGINGFNMLVKQPMDLIFGIELFEKAESNIGYFLLKKNKLFLRDSLKTVINADVECGQMLVLYNA